MEYKSFEEMPVWQKAMDLAIKIYGLTEGLPRKEGFGLTSQIRNSGLSDGFTFGYFFNLTLNLGLRLFVILNLSLNLNLLFFS